MLIVALLLAIGSVSAKQNASTVEALRMKILSEINPKVPPSTSQGQGNQVLVQFRVFKVLGVDLPSGRLRFKAWRRMRWFDDRLKWNPVSAWPEGSSSAIDAADVSIVRLLLPRPLG